MIQTTRADFKYTGSSRLCSAHFVDSDFTEKTLISRNLGLPFKAQLKEGAIPSVFARKSTPTAAKLRRVEIEKNQPSAAPVPAPIHPKLKVKHEQLIAK